MSVEQTPEKSLKRDGIESIISPYKTSEKKRKNNPERDNVDRNAGNDKVDFGVSSNTVGDENLPVNDQVKCLELVFPNHDRYGVNVCLLKTIGELVAECLRDIEPPMEGKFCLMCEDENVVDPEMLSKDLDFEACYHIKSC